jgi:hypothetical protein
VQVADEVSREGKVTSSNPADRVAAKNARDFDGDGRALASGPLPRLKFFSGFFSHFFISRFVERRALGKEAFADRIFTEGALPRATLGKSFAESLRGFDESLEPSAKQPALVVSLDTRLS